MLASLHVPVAKLALAKADTTNLISSLVPQPRDIKRPRPALFPAVSARRFALIIAPFLLMSFFLIGLSIGGGKPARPGEPVLNKVPDNIVVRLVNRKAPGEGLINLVRNNNERHEAATDDIDAEAKRQPTPRIITQKPDAEEEIITTAPSVPAPVEPVVVSEDIHEATDEPIDLFGFGLNVIRSARENMEL